MFAYVVQTACDKNEWILGYSAHSGNHQDSRTFKSLCDKIKDMGIKTLIADARYFLLVMGILFSMPTGKFMEKRTAVWLYDSLLISVSYMMGHGFSPSLYFWFLVNLACRHF